MFDKLNFFTHSLGIKMLNFKHVGLNVLVLIILLAVVESGGKITGTVIPIFSFLRRLATILHYQDVTSELHILYIWRENSNPKSEASFVLTAQSITIERDWEWRPMASSISAILATRCVEG